METITRTSLAETAAEKIREELAHQRWELGSRLPNEATLSATLSISRGTVREAVKILVTEGYLETRQGSGTYVRSLSNPASGLLRARRAGLRDLFEARCALDVEAARLAAARAVPVTVAELRALLATRGNYRPGDDRDSFIARDLAFHKAVVAASGNRAMVEIYEFFSASIEETIKATLHAEVPEPDMAAHAAIVDAIEAGDPARADAAVRAFMAPVFKALDRILLS